MLVDVGDTWIKGGQYLASQGVEYGIRTAVGISLCAIAAHVESERFHITFVVASLVYQASWILRLYDVLG